MSDKKQKVKRLNVSIDEDINLILGLMKNKKKKSELVNKSLVFFLKNEENLKDFFDDGAIKIIKLILENKSQNNKIDANSHNKRKSQY